MDIITNTDALGSDEEAENAETMELLCSDLAGEVFRDFLGYDPMRADGCYVKGTNKIIARPDALVSTAVSCIVERKRCRGYLQKKHRNLFKKIVQVGTTQVTGSFGKFMKHRCGDEATIDGEKFSSGPQRESVMHISRTAT